jgi:two-component system nitrogen regulation response regulator NtrX
MERFSREHGTGDKSLTDDAMEFLKKYPWPGNVRELKNIIERVVIMVISEEIGVNDLQKYLVPEVKDTPASLQYSGLPLKDARDAFEKEYIISALKFNGGNVSETARQLDIERTNLHRKIRQFNINADKL